jgi:hypothetical protein
VANILKNGPFGPQRFLLRPKLYIFSNLKDTVDPKYKTWGIKVLGYLYVGANPGLSSSVM